MHACAERNDDAQSVSERLTPGGRLVDRGWCGIVGKELVSDGRGSQQGTGGISRLTDDDAPKPNTTLAAAVALGLGVIRCISWFFFSMAALLTPSMYLATCTAPDLGVR